MLIKMPVFLSLYLLVIIFTHLTNAKSTKWVIGEHSSLTVNGRTNLSKFSCIIDRNSKEDTINVERDKHTNKITLSGNMRMAVAGFDCNNRMMTRELRKTLKQEQYPEISINFLSINGLPELNNTPIGLKGMVEIEIAGVKKKFEINYTIYMDADKVIQLHAIRNINFSDFGLIPPRKIGNLVQAKDKLGVELNLKMRAI